MNERIKELAIQVQRTEIPGVLFAHPEFVEKFAEAIIRECMIICDGVTKKNNTAVDCWIEIKKHFGVE